MLPPPTLRTGLVGEVGEDATQHLVTVAALLRAFAKDALGVAGRYACGQRRRVVTGTDMRSALMYCARTFFEQGDAVLTARVEDESAAMMRDAEESGEESSGEESSDAEESGEEHTDNEEESVAPPPSTEDVALVRHVDAVVHAWHLWEPTDAVHVLIKRAIDQTPVE